MFSTHLHGIIDSPRAIDQPHAPWSIAGTGVVCDDVQDGVGVGQIVESTATAATEEDNIQQKLT